MSFPLIREKVKRGAITENKKKDLTKSSSTLLVDEEALSLLFFIFLSPLSLKSLFAGERFGMVQQHLQRDGWQLTSDRPSELWNRSFLRSFPMVSFGYSRGGDELVNRSYRDRAADDLGHRDVTRNLSRELWMDSASEIVSWFQEVKVETLRWNDRRYVFIY